MSLSDHYLWMRRAVDLARESQPEGGRTDHSPAVGAVIVKDGVEIASAFRGQCAPGNHAEHCALIGVRPDDVQGSVVYTTLEPCSRRNPPKIPCAQRLIDAGVRTVFIGLYDPNPSIYREGWRMLRDAGTELRDFPTDLRNELRQLNHGFLHQYESSSATRGSVRFDYVMNPSYSIGPQGKAINTRWSHAASGVVHAYTPSGHIALARYAKSIREVDDPSAMDFSPEVHSVTAKAGEVVVFRGSDGTSYGIVRVDHVLSHQGGDDRSELAFSFEVREAGSRFDDLQDSAVG
jgi:pyrimidine deaminase RibD-like protein